jgi:hypothetical protein
MPRTFSDDELELYGLRSADAGGVLFCGVTAQQFAINGVTYKWPVNRGLTWGMGASQLGRLASADIQQVYRDCFAEIMAACDFEISYNPNGKTANFVMTAARLDGAGGVLADHQIPMNNRQQQLVGRYDVSEQWVIAQNPPRGTIDFHRVALHELLHGMGLGHGPVDRSNPALIEPTYSQAIRHLQPRDKAELVRRYGPPKKDAPPATPAGNAGQVVIEELTIRTPDGKRYSAKGTANPLQLVAE